MFFAGQFQHGYVTRDLEAAVRDVTAHYDVASFDYVDAEIPVRTPAGEGLAVFRVALAWVGHRQFELIQPGSGPVDLYRGFLPADASLRFHHLGMRCDDLAPIRAAAAQRGWSVAMEGSVPGIDFLYVDAREPLGHYLEYICPTAEALAGMGWPADLALSR